MPCYDSRDREDDYKTFELIKSERDQYKAMLCAALRYIQDKDLSLSSFRDETDWFEAGVDFKKLSDFFYKHQEEDEKRRIKENEEKRKKTLIKNALDKLSIEEKEALGFISKE